MGALIDIIVSLAQLIFDILEDLFYAIGLAVKVVASIPQYIGWLPSTAITLVVVAVGIALVFKVIGREG